MSRRCVRHGGNQAFAAFLSVLAVAVVVSGCGRGPKMVPVQGRIVHPDGKPIKASVIRLLFIPLDATPGLTRSGTAVVDPATGRFERASTFKEGDGLVAGRHRVVVRLLGDQGQPLGAIAEIYASMDKSPLVIDTADRELVITVPLL